MAETIEIPSSATPAASESAASPAAVQFDWKTGEFTQDAPADSSSAPAKSSDSPSDAMKGPEVATGDDESDQPLTPAAKKAANRNLRAELIRANARAELLESQLAESRKSAPAAAKEVKPDAKPKDVGTEPPDLEKYPGTNDGVRQWQRDTAKYYRDEARRDAEALINDRFSRENQRIESSKTNESWNSQVTAAKAEHADYEAVVFNEADPVPSSPVLNEQIARHPQGAAIAYWLATNREAAEEYAEATEIDAMTPEALYAAAKANPQIQARLLEARGMAKAFLNGIAKQLKVAPKTETPIKDIIARKPRPSAETGRAGSGNIAGDAEAEAVKSGDFAKMSEVWEAKARGKS